MLFFGKKKIEQAANAVANGDQQDYWSIVRRQFRKNRLAVWSLYCFYLILFIAIFADFIANEKPLVCSLKQVDEKGNYVVNAPGDTATSIHFPIIHQYLVDWGFAQWEPRFKEKKWHEHNFEWAVFPPVTYLPNTFDKRNKPYTAPGDEQKMGKNNGWHYFGTDDLQRDVAAGMIHGTRTAMLVGIISMSISLLIGIFFGAIAGYFGDDRLKMSRIRIVLNILAFIAFIFYGFIVRGYALADSVGKGYLMRETLITTGLLVGFFAIANILAIPLKRIPFLGKKVRVAMDILIMRLIEIVNSIPVLILILAVVAIIKTPSIVYVMGIIGLVSWTGIAKFLRAELLRVRRLEYIEAAQAFGYSEWRIIWRHAIPNALAPVLIALAFGIASAILTESFLSFLGVGVPAEQVTWGSLLSLSRQNPSAWWLAIFPGIAIFVTVTIFNLLGEGLTDALDPRLKQ